MSIVEAVTFRFARRICLTVCGLVAFSAGYVHGVAFGLPAGREYELVSPVFKGGFGALRIEGVAPDGESVLFYSPGAFAGAPSGPDLMDYLARRGATEWSTTSLIPPASSIAYLEGTDVSPSLDAIFAVGKPGPEFENSSLAENMFLHSTGLPDTASGWGPTLGTVEPVTAETGLFVQEKAADPDFCHIMLESGTPMLAEAGGAQDQLYEFHSGCNGEPAGLTLVGLDNQGNVINPECAVDVGNERYTLDGVDTFNAVNTEGSEVFFTDCLSGRTGTGSPHQLFVRIAGSRTVEVSRPLSESCPEGEVPCPGALARGSADFAGASEDGAQVYFTAPLTHNQEPLVAGDTDVSNNLYLAKIGCPENDAGCAPNERVVTSLVEASHVASGAADVRGVVRISPNAERAFFVAGGDLLDSSQRQMLEGEGRATPQVGADNMYVYDASTESVSFIGDLCSSDELSGDVADIHCPRGLQSDASLWSTDHPEAQTAGLDGNFLVFATYAQLTRDDTDTSRDVYRYDAASGTLERVSVGESGYDSNGNGEDSGSGEGSFIMAGHHGEGEEGGPVRSQYEMSDRAISEDGSRIVFMSVEPLSSQASNGIANAYEWHEVPGGTGGELSLISSGSGEEPIEDVVISPNGLSVVFDGVESLVSQDLDGAPDVYDARLEEPSEGFPQQVAEAPQCEGEACHGPLTNPTPLLVPGSVSQTPGENFAPPKPMVKKKPKGRTKAGKKQAKKKRKMKKRGRGKASRRLGRVGGTIGGGTG